MSPKTIEERLDRLDRKNALLLLISLGAFMATQSRRSRWLKLPFIVADCLLIADTATELWQEIKDRK